MSEVKEGFLCPMCMADLGDDTQLLVHFDEQHSKEDPAIVKSFKDMFAKAKTKIVKDHTPTPTPDTSIVDQAEFSKDLYGREPSHNHPVSGIHYDILDESDNKIEVVDKFDQFRLERAKRADLRTSYMNKLILRLDRLMTQLPSDPVKRRNHEMNVVPWINEKDVSLCPGCAKSFGMIRRKHHCRLCGGVMCEECSGLVSFDQAQRLINPVTISKFSQGEEQLQNVSPSKSKLSYDGIVSNLVDLAGFAEAQRNFRSCLNCKAVLDQRDLRLSMTSAPEPDLLKYYAHLQSVLQQGMQMSDKYRQMHESLINGESTYRIEDVKILRLQVLKAAETVDAISKKIEALPAEDPSTQKTLQKRIRNAAVNFVKETLVGLPSAPTPEEFKEIEKRKAYEAKKRIENEKLRAEEAKQKAKSLKTPTPGRPMPGPSPSSTGLANFPVSAQSMISNAVTSSKRQLKFPSKRNEVKMGQGFVASCHGKETLEDDPIGQQIYNLKQFIQQARDKGHFDDARILETNLRDMQEEYRKIKSEEQQELMQNYEDLKSKGMFSKSTNENHGNGAGENLDEELDESNPFFDAEDGTNNPFTESTANHSDDENNPFNKDEENDDYDKSGKNPFA